MRRGPGRKPCTARSGRPPPTRCFLLRQLGLPGDDPRARAGCEVLLDGARCLDGGLNLAKTVQEPETCITAMMVCLAATFGAVDGRVQAALSWLLDQQLDDGGWNYETIRSGSRHGWFHTTIAALEALQAWTLGVVRTARVDGAARGPRVLGTGGSTVVSWCTSAGAGSAPRPPVDIRGRGRGSATNRPCAVFVRAWQRPARRTTPHTAP